MAHGGEGATAAGSVGAPAVARIATAPAAASGPAVTRLPDWLLGALLAAAPLVLATFKIGVVCRFNPGTVEAVIASADPVRAYIAALAPSAAVVLMMFPAVVIAVWRQRARHWELEFLIPLVAAALVFLVLLYTALPWSLAAVVLLFGGLTVPAYLRVAKESLWLALRRWAVCWVLILACASTVLPGGSWLPAEIVRTSDGMQRIAYIVDVGSEWTTLLLVRTDLVERVRTADVVSRRICDLAVSQRSLASVVWHDPSYERCPDAGRR